MTGELLALLLGALALLLGAVGLSRRSGPGVRRSSPPSQHTAQRDQEIGDELDRVLEEVANAATSSSVEEDTAEMLNRRQRRP